VTRVATLHGDEPVRVHVVVPVDTEHNRLVEALDEALLGRLREAARDSGEENPQDAALAARHALDTSVQALAGAGVQTDGSLSGDDPVPDALALVESLPADEIVVVTPPHLLEEAFNRDWASRLRDRSGRPVLHFVAGTDRVVN
jgi:hypothetical protein